MERVELTALLFVSTVLAEAEEAGAEQETESQRTWNEEEKKKN
jgi:hypothetical protein